MTILDLKEHRDGEESITVGQLIDFLSDYDPMAEIFIRRQGDKVGRMPPVAIEEPVYGVVVITG